MRGDDILFHTLIICFKKLHKHIYIKDETSGNIGGFKQNHKILIIYVTSHFNHPRK